MSFVDFCQKIDRVITAPHCTDFTLTVDTKLLRVIWTYSKRHREVKRSRANTDYVVINLLHLCVNVQIFDIAFICAIYRISPETYIFVVQSTVSVIDFGRIVWNILAILPIFSSTLPVKKLWRISIYLIEAATKWPTFRKWCYRCVLLNKYVQISINISLKFAPKGEIKIFQYWLG